jgi:acetate kinase
MTAAILVLNAGSSSLKFALRDAAAPERRLLAGDFEELGTAATFRARDAAGAILVVPPVDPAASHAMALGLLLPWLQHAMPEISLVAAGHRVVHGGARFTAPVVIDKGVLAALDALVPLAPLHQPHNLAAIRAVAAAAPGLSQVACFDTAFHATIAPVVQAFALPQALADEGIRRYGFHGLSYEYIAGQLRALAPGRAAGRVVVAHLGNGASLCAMRGGQSIATTMGFSALDGLMMGTRTGSIDPAVIFYLMRDQKMTAAEVEAMMYQKSGLLGVSDISNDMRKLREATGTHNSAREAIDMFTYRIIREAGAMIAIMGGIDALIFTAGIGENDTELRADVIKGLSYAGFSLDEMANNSKISKISSENGAVALVMPTNEEVMIARETAALISNEQK